METPQIELNNGVRIPQLGFGVFQVPAEDTVDVVLAALHAGYRHIDAAQGYRNEKEVGDAIERSGIDPDEIFVTSKLGNAHITYDDAQRAIDGSLSAIRLKTPDLFLIHWPLATVRDFMVVWRALEERHADGTFPAIGVSNFHAPHLERLLEESDIVPAVNQIEVHPYLTQQSLRALNAAHGIVTEAWSPIAQGLVLTDPVIVEIAQRLGRSPAQVVLRWHVQAGTVVFPKSASPERMAENFAIFDFELDQDDVLRISALNRDERTGGDPDTFRYTW